MSNSASRRLLLLSACLLAMLAIPSLSVASAAPIVTAGAATNLTLNTATANGTVDPNGGGNTTVKVEYGKSILYGTTKTIGTVSGTGVIPVSSVLAGLETLTTYHFRIKAENSGGTTVSSDQAFEMLLQWKVGGKPAAERAAEFGQSGVKYSAEQSPGNNLIVKGVGGLSNLEITCQRAEHELTEHGTLNAEYFQSYEGCKTFVKGVESKTCAPQSNFVLQLNSVLVPVKGTAFQLGALCVYAEEISLTGGGFELGPLAPEALNQNITLVEHLSNATVTATNMTWHLVTPFNVFKFGIS